MIVATFLVATLVTYGLRSGVTVIGRPVPGWLDRVAGLVTPAILASMVASGVLVSGADNRVHVPSPAVIAAVGVTFAVTRRRGTVIAGLACGTATYWIGNVVGLA